MDKILFAVIALLVLGGGVLVFNTDTAPDGEKINNNYQNVEPIGEVDNKREVPRDVNETKVSGNNTILDLSNQNLTSVPQITFSNTAILELSLANNSLTGSLPGEIRFLQNLKVLNLSNNQFTGLPAEIGQLQNLEVLDVSNNKITGLPNELGNLKNLKVLKLTGNQYSVSDLEGIKNKLPASVVIELN
ncbi:leucine-rich repeat domain-containing protein [Patescibacteria group bacterium]|nr:leucine-rich repeat domain-containing protein [Patescibacteria group bacterium]